MRVSRSLTCAVAALAVVVGLVATPAGTAQAQAPAPCLTADYSASVWDTGGGGGFVASVRITNHCGTAVPNWRLVLTYGDTDVTLHSGWNRIWRQEGDQIIGEGQPGTWNGQIGAGTNLQVGFVASFTGAYHDPTGCTINGSLCDPAANEPPEVSMLMPTEGSGLAAPCPATLIAAASDPDGVVMRVEFYLNDVLVGISTTAPYQVEVPSAELNTFGANVVRARAFDYQGAHTDSVAVSFNYVPPPPALLVIDCVAGALPVPAGGSQAVPLRQACGLAEAPEVTAVASGDPAVTVAPSSFLLPSSGAEVTVSAAPGSAGATATVTITPPSGCIAASFPVTVTGG